MDKLAYEIPGDVLPALGRIDLAREPDFALGVLTVSPSRLEVAGGGVRRALQRRVMQVLVALARSPGRVVSQHELVSRCWGGLSVSDDAIGRCIAQLRQLTQAWPEPPFAIETIAGVGYRLDAAKVELGAPGEASPRRGISRWVLALAAVAALTLGGVAAWRFGVRPAQAPAAFPTVEVTSFQSADDQPASRAYAATLTGEVSDAASRYNLVVFKPAQAEASTGADFLVGGRIVRKGAERTITSDLVDAHNGVVVYSFDTPAPANSKVDAAAEIAGRIAHALDPSKLTNDLAGKLSPADYTLVARANEAIDRWDIVDALAQNRALAQRHPDDGDLQASTAISAIFAAQTAPRADRGALIALARRSVAQAERLNPSSALLCNARQLLLGGPLSYAAQERELRRAVQLDPNLHVTFNALGELMLLVGRTHEGIGLITRSIQLDPMSEVVVATGGRDFVEAGALDEARDAIRREQTLWPEHGQTVRYLNYLVALYLGAPRDVVAIVGQDPAPIHHSVPAPQREAMLQALETNDPGAVRRLVAQCFANYGRSGEQVGDEECLIEMVERGALDDAFRFAELAYPDRRTLYPVGADGWLIDPPLSLDKAWLFTPRMKSFREDPRFRDVAVRLGLVAYWRSTGAWPDICTSAEPEPECPALKAAAQPPKA